MRQTKRTIYGKALAGFVAALLLACAVPLAALAGQPEGTQTTSLAQTSFETSLSEVSELETSLVGEETSLLERESESELESEEGAQAGPANGMLRAAPQTAGSWAAFELALAAIEADDGIGTITLTGSFAFEAVVNLDGLQLKIVGDGHTLEVNTYAQRHFNLLNNASLTLVDVVLEGNDVGGGIDVRSYCSLDMTGGAIKNCRMSRGGAMVNQGSTVLTDVLVDKCVMDYSYPAGVLGSNATGHGSSIYSQGTLTLAGNTVVQRGTPASNTTSTIYGSVSMQGNALITDTSYGIYANGGTITMADNSGITYTTVSAIRVDLGSLTMSGSSYIMNNTSSTNHFYNVQLYSANLTMSGTAQISYNRNNSASGGFGGGVWSSQWTGDRVGTIRLSGNSQISNNYSMGAGGGIYAVDTHVYVTGNSQISYNEAVAGGGGVYFSQNTSGNYINMEVNNNAAMIGNYSGLSGGAIYVYARHAYSHYLGTDYSSGQSGPRIQNNRAAQDGGGIYIAQTEAAFDWTQFYPFGLTMSGNWAGNGPKTYNLPTRPANATNIYTAGTANIRSISLPTIRTTSAINNYDVAVYGGSILAGLVDVEFYIDDNTIPAHTKTVLAGSMVDEPTLADLGLPAGTQLDGWYDDKDGVGIPANKWDFGSHTAAAPGPVKLYAKTLLDPTHEVKVTFYKDSVTAANQLFTDTWDVDEGEATLAALRTRWSLAAADDPLNWKNPDTSLYKTGALVTPATLPPTVDAPLEIVILYAPFAQNDVIFYLNYGPGGDTNEYTRYTNQTEGTTFSAPTDPVREGYVLWKWTTAPAQTSTEWVFATDTMPDTQLKLYAQYMKDSFTVTFDYTQVTAGRTVPRTVEFESPLPAMDTSVSGYTFVGWRYESGYWDMDNDTMPAKNITLIGVWTRNTTPPTSSSSSTTSGGGGNESSAPPPSSSTPRPRSSSSGSTSVSSSAPVVSSAPVASSAPVVSSSSAPTPDDELDTGLGRQMGLLNIPLGDFGEDSGWSLFNLLLAIAGLVSAAFLAVRAVRTRRGSPEEDERGGRGSLWLWLSAASGALPAVLWPILENLRGDMLWFSRWTPLFIALALAHCALGVFTLLYSRKRADRR